MDGCTGLTWPDVGMMAVVAVMVVGVAWAYAWSTTYSDGNE